MEKGKPGIRGHRENPPSAGRKAVAMNEESLFAAALEKEDAAERQAYLEEACGQDVLLRRRVEKLLAAHGQARGILERGPDDVSLKTEPQESAIAADRRFAGRFNPREN